jgi:iron(III) transport system ATP-binding protein
MRPAVVLLDEPLANLDAHLRDAMKVELRRFHREIGATFVYVTHDQSEAMALADRIAVMDRGVLEQVATPERLYGEPATPMVARFVAHGMVLPARIRESRPAGAVVDLLGATLTVRGTGRPGEERPLCLRPGDLRLAEEGIACTVTAAIFQGPVTVLSLAPAAGGPELTMECRGPVPTVGTAVKIAAADGWLVPGGPR